MQAAEVAEQLDNTESSGDPESGVYRSDGKGLPQARL